MLEKLTNASVKLISKYLPDPYLFAVLLTLIAFSLSWGLTGQTPMEITRNWGTGFWGLLAFSMQMVLVLVLGHTLAQATPIKKTLVTIASLPKNPTQAIVIVTLATAGTNMINWGFGLVTGALLAKEMAKRVEADYRLLIAASYASFLFWHGGFSSSVALSLASADTNFAVITGGVLAEPIGITQTLFSPVNITLQLVLITVVTLLNAAMHPKKKENTVLINKKLLEEADTPPPIPANLTPAGKLEHSHVLSWIIGGLGTLFVVDHFVRNGFALDLNIVNFIFLMAAILLHGTPAKLLTAVSVAIKGAGSIVLQFPFYAGIMGIIAGANAYGVSLGGIMSDSFVNIATAQTLPMFAFLSSGLLNIFVPSGGGQWALQAPIFFPAAQELGADLVTTAMAIAWGDSWTNLLQPFWALPALAVAKLGAKDIMGFLLLHTVIVGVIASVIFVIF